MKRFLITMAILTWFHFLLCGSNALTPFPLREKVAPQGSTFSYTSAISQNNAHFSFLHFGVMTRLCSFSFMFARIFQFFFKIFFLSLIVSQFEYDIPTCRMVFCGFFWVFILYYLSIFDLMPVINFGKFLDIITATIYSVPFSLSFPSGISITCVIHFVIVPQFLIFYSIFLILFSLHLSLEVSTDTSSSSLIPTLGYVQSANELLHFCSIVFISGTYFDYFLEYLSAHITRLCSHVVHFSLEPLAC